MGTTDDPYHSFLVADFSSLTLDFYLVNGLIVGVLLFLSALVSGSEVAFFSLSEEQLKACEADEDSKSSGRVVSLLRRPQRLLATILILNNLINIFIVTISTFATWQIFQDEPTGWSIVILTGSITILIVFFGEIMPKVYANQNNLGFARFTGSFLFLFDKMLQPFSWMLLKVGRGITKKTYSSGYQLSVTEISHALEIAAEDEATNEEKDILRGIVQFGTISVKQIMRSRMDIMALDIETDFHELMNQINKTGYSRIPIYSETIDKIEGILYIKDVLTHIDKEEDFNWRALLRPSYFVPESKKIDDLLKDFQEKRVHMAIVVDEYGGTEGLITMEDVIEEIVGEINDEFDEGSDIAYNKLDSQTYVFEGRTSLTDFCRVIQTDPQDFEEVKGESESLGGLLLEINSKLPHAGEQIVFGRYLFTVVAVDQRRIKRVRVYISPAKKQ